MALRRKRKIDPPAPGLFDPDTIDLVTLGPDGRTVRLYIVCDVPWSGADAQLHSLQEKVHGYVGFAVDGQLVAAHPAAAGERWEIVLDCQAGPPDPRTAATLSQLAAAVRCYAGDLLVLANPA